ncbi:hypothetical protein Poly51_04410 [Rubripirellula tenax]|uniref:Acyltransferase 3 domain-containing protein n=1 Tax=Rubripirellula tenax TaxID=2528015 RepID=A0A5C6FEC4_9BACT|nr:acyltransferase [Rubripirellula tenax]TWU60166.1 hypothetical protein Poly51_04410 [Rubripirellula tenax]
MNPPVKHDLSPEAKQTFSVVGLLATVLVVGIHYKSDVPDQPFASLATANQLAQEFVFGGLARVAVPIFAFAAGLFYFRSDDGTFASYKTKLAGRTRTVLIPYFIVASVAMLFWLFVRRAEGKPIDVTAPQFVTTWLLRPPAEQLWFLRDLMILVAIAPAIGWFCRRPVACRIFIGAVATAWVVDWQVFPMLAGWRSLQMETLLFFSLGCIAVSHYDVIERIGRSQTSTIVAAVTLWMSLVVVKILVRANFDMWYCDDHSLPDVLLHQASIVVGVPVLFAIAWRMRSPWLVRLSGGSFFVYLVHEFPLRAVAHRISDRFIDHDYSCWILTPLVLVGCYTAVVLISRFCPSAISMLTGGRIPGLQSKPVGKLSPLSEPN